MASAIIPRCLISYILMSAYTQMTGWGVVMDLKVYSNMHHKPPTQTILPIFQKKLYWLISVQHTLLLFALADRKVKIICIFLEGGAVSDNFMFWGFLSHHILFFLPLLPLWSNIKTSKPGRGTLFLCITLVLNCYNSQDKLFAT